MLNFIRNITSLKLFAVVIALCLIYVLAMVLMGSSWEEGILAFILLTAMWGAMFAVYWMLRSVKHVGDQIKEENTFKVLMCTTLFCFGTLVLRIPAVLGLSEFSGRNLAGAIFIAPAIIADIYALVWGFRLAKKGLLLQSVPLYAPFIVDYFLIMHHPSHIRFG